MQVSKATNWLYMYTNIIRTNMLCLFAVVYISLLDYHECLDTRDQIYSVVLALEMLSHKLFIANKA